MDKIIIKRHNINYNVYIMVLIGKGVRNIIIFGFVWIFFGSPFFFWEGNLNILWFSRFRFNHLINNLIKNR